MNLTDAVEVFLRHCRLERGLSPFTINAYQLDLQQFLSRQQAHGRMTVAAVDKNTIRKYLEWQASTNRAA